MSDYEPPAEMVEALERDIRRLTGVPYHLGQTMSVTILRRQHERERGLLEAINKLARLGCGHMTGNSEGNIIAQRALAAHAKLDAPKVPEAPTLLEAAKRIANKASVEVLYTDCATHVTLNGWPTALEDIQALKVAVEREEKR